MLSGSDGPLDLERPGAGPAGENSGRALISLESGSLAGRHGEVQPCGPVPFRLAVTESADHQRDPTLAFDALEIADGALRSRLIGDGPDRPEDVGRKRRMIGERIPGSRHRRER